MLFTTKLHQWSGIMALKKYASSDVNWEIWHQVRVRALMFRHYVNKFETGKIKYVNSCPTRTAVIWSNYDR